jgi:hypothetical protein
MLTDSYKLENFKLCALDLARQLDQLASCMLILAANAERIEKADAPEFAVAAAAEAVDAYIEDLCRSESALFRAFAAETKRTVTDA